MKYRFHRAVISEHFDNIVFYENRLPGLGADYLNEFETVMAHICTAPNFYPTIAAPDIHKAGLKRFPFHVIYRVMPTQIIVLAVAHQRRHPAYWAGRVGETMIANVGRILCTPLFAVRVGAWNTPWLEALNEELEVLNTQARELEQTIAQNVVEILEA